MPESLRAVVVADGDPDPVALAAALDGDDADDGTQATLMVVAADGGARSVEASGRLPDLIVGDADSLAPGDIERFRARGVRVDVHPAEKDASDTELALEAALAGGARAIQVVGAMGGDRVEHTIANLLLLAHPMLDDADPSIRTGRSTIRRIGTQHGPATLELSGAAGDYVSLLPLEFVVAGVTTTGLRYPLDDAELALGLTRGLSNELVAEAATVRTRSGRMLVIHTPRDTDGHREATR